MNKNIVAVFAAVCGLFMVSCDTPSDLRPDTKVSVDYVQPGTRNTHNIGKENEVHGAGAHETEVHEQQILPNHEAGATPVQATDSTKESAETNTAAGAVRR